MFNNNEKITLVQQQNLPFSLFQKRGFVSLCFSFFHGRVVTVTSLLEIGFYLLLLIQVEKMVNSLSRFCESLFTFVSHRKGMNNIFI